jgi:ribosomal-protein-alanine N-acetyltransferase
MEHKGTVKIETERLILRRFEPNDILPCFKNWMSDERVTRFLRWLPHESEEETARILNMWIDFYKNLPFYQWAIVPKELGEPIGSISVMSVKEKTETIHIGYCIGFDWWGRGYASEALDALIRFFFESVGALRIESQHDPENRASGRVMEKCGMQYEGTLRKADFSNRGIVDACVYAILAEDYRKKSFA